MSKNEVLFEAVERRAGDFGPHYTIYAARGMEALRKLFPEGKADEMNFVLFSTAEFGALLANESKEIGEKLVGLALWFALSSWGVYLLAR